MRGRLAMDQRLQLHRGAGACPLICLMFAHVAEEAMDGLLDRGLLAGQHEVMTSLRPHRPARPVDTADLSAALAEITYACQVWGGGAQPLLPVSEGVISAEYLRLLGSEQVDGLARRQRITFANLPDRVESGMWHDDPVLPIVAHERKEEWRAVQVVDLDPDDPWRVAYAASLGHWPSSPDPGLSEHAFIPEDLAFEDLLPVDRVSATGSLDDLLERLGNSKVLTPRQVSTIMLATGQGPDTYFMGGRPDVWAYRPVQRAAGPNIVVIMTPDSVADLALLWNLRGAHGFGRALPIGVPRDEVTAAVLRRLQEPGTATPFGLGGGKIHLVSASLTDAELRQLVAQSPTAQVAAVPDLLTFGRAPGRDRTHLALWDGGHTRLEPMSESDQDVLRVARGMVRSPQLVLDVSVVGRHLPADPTMRGTEIGGRFQAGAAQVSVSDLRRRDTVSVYWPTTWTCLAAVAHTRGLGVRESEPGLAASTLIRAVGGVRDVILLSDPKLIELLYRMAERSGMSWWKNRWKQAHAALLAAGADEAALEEVAREQGREDPAVAPPGDGRSVAFHEFTQCLGSEKASRHWVMWAERHHLLVRGAEVSCPDCNTTSWLPLAAVPPPVPCPGCGRQITQPYNPKALTFSFRLGEALRRVLETDSLGHVLTLRWLYELFQERGLVGMHPGVAFIGSDGTDLGEADVLMLFADGAMVPVEVKRRVSGVEGRTAGLMDILADALNARCDILAVTQPARDVPELAELIRRVPGRPRFVVTTDQLFEQDVIWSLGSDPFAFDPRSAEADADRHNSLRMMLERGDPDAPFDHLGEALLNPELKAFHLDQERKEPGTDLPA